MANISQKTYPRLRLSKLFFYLLLLFFPFQTKIAHFTDSSFYFGYHAFYNTLFFYFTDILAGLVMLAWFCEKLYFSPRTNPQQEDFSRENKESNPRKDGLVRGEREKDGSRGPSTSLGTTAKRIIEKISHDSVYLFAVAFWLILATSLIFSRENLLGSYGLMKITEFLLIFAFARENFSPRTNLELQDFSRENLRLIMWMVVIGASFQAVIALFQYLSQSSIGLSILGEEFLRPALSGVAKFATHGIANPLLYDFLPYLSAISDTHLVMRGYGTFPHPNLLGAYLFFGLIFDIYLLYTLNPGKGFHVKRVFLLAGLILLTLGLTATFSRLIWVATVFGLFVFFALILFKYRSAHMGNLKTGQVGRDASEDLYFPGRAGLIAIGLLVSLSINFFLFGTQIKDRLGAGEIGDITSTETYLDRKVYGNVAWKMFLKNPVFGVGLRNFVVEMDHYSREQLLPYQHQPAHNIYLLVLAEAGLLGLVVFLLLLFDIVRPAFAKASAGEREKRKPPLLGECLLIIFFGFLGLGLFDHYFLSLHQGGLMFWLVAGLLVSE